MWDVVLGCVCILLLVGSHSLRSSTVCDRGSILGFGSCEVWYKIRGDRGLSHPDCWGWACGGGNVARVDEEGGGIM